MISHTDTRTIVVNVGITDLLTALKSANPDSLVIQGIPTSRSDCSITLDDTGMRITYRVASHAAPPPAMFGLRQQ